MSTLLVVEPQAIPYVIPDRTTAVQQNDAGVRGVPEILYFVFAQTKQAATPTTATTAKPTIFQVGFAIPP